jgi:hypothetical protein
MMNIDSFSGKLNTNMSYDLLVDPASLKNQTSVCLPKTNVNN